MTEKLHYDFDLRLDDPVSTHAVQFQLIPNGAKVLDIGCHTGILGAALKSMKNCEVVGIDNDEAALEVADERLDATLRLDLEKPGWTEMLSALHHDGFDIILFGDVLEHTRDPQSILAESKSLLRKNGRVIVSLPNVANLRVRLSLLRGKFDYTDAGILDYGHLRFYTRRSARAFVEQAGFTVLRETWSGYSLPRWLIDLFPSILAVNIILVARKK